MVFQQLFAVNIACTEVKIKKKETSHLSNKDNSLTGRQVVAWPSWEKEKPLALHDDVRLQ